MEKYIRSYGLYDVFICNENFCECVVGRNPIVILSLRKEIC